LFDGEAEEFGIVGEAEVLHDATRTLENREDVAPKTILTVNLPATRLVPFTGRTTVGAQ
jgi:hypothetical protein